LITINRPLDVVEPPKIRDDRFHGGRCEVNIVNPWNWYTTLRVQGVKGKYIDAVSLYPTVMYYDRYPVGHPTKNCVLIIYAKKETTAYSVIHK